MGKPTTLKMGVEFTQLHLRILMPLLIVTGLPQENSGEEARPNCLVNNEAKARKRSSQIMIVLP
jgi:hypothetical protein